MSLFKVKVARITYDEIAVSAPSEKEAKKLLQKNRDWQYDDFDKVESISKVTRPSDCPENWLDMDCCCWSKESEPSLSEAFYDNLADVLYQAIDDYRDELVKQVGEPAADDAWEKLADAHYAACKAIEADFLAQAKAGK